MLIDDTVTFDNGFKLSYNLTIETAKGDMVEYEVIDTDMKEDTTFHCPKITGRVINKTDKDENLAYLTILYYNSDGKVIGIDNTYVSDVSAGGKTSFDCKSLYLDDSIKFEDIAKYEVKAYSRYYQY